jgi:hypothetical protein
MPGKRATEPAVLKFDANCCIIAVPDPAAGKYKRYTVHRIYRWADKRTDVIGREMTLDEARKLTNVREPAAAEASTGRLLRWIDERLALITAEEKRVGVAGAAHEITEREVLADVMLILDGREPTNKRRWS